jgi:hypothetical protein
VAPRVKSSGRLVHQDINCEKSRILGNDRGGAFAARGFDAALNEIGMNTGNAMFQFALWDRITNPKFVCSVYDDPAIVRSNADVLVIPSANQINPAWDLTAWAEFVEAVDLPCVVIGLGAQAPIDANPILELQSGTLRYVRALAERSSVLGVRGRFTAEVLASLGITNVAVVGCPSQIINSRIKGAAISEKIAKLTKHDNPYIGYVFGTMEPCARETEATLSKLIDNYEHKIVFQTGRKFLHYLFDGTIEDDARNFFEWIINALGKHLTVDQYIQYLRNYGCFFSDARTWVDSMRQLDLVIGMRIHGAVAAIQSGGLGVCVAFDSRTLELAHTMGYPYIRTSRRITLLVTLLRILFSTLDVSIISGSKTHKQFSIL